MTMVLAVSFLSLLVAVGVAAASKEINITEKLGGVSGDFFNVDGTMLMDSVKIGRQGEGGVTFFNGTIVNSTTSSGADNPVTFGDNVRIDGRIHRGLTSGPEGSAETPMPVIINDDLNVLGDVMFESGREVDFTGTNVKGLTMGGTKYAQVVGAAFQPIDPTNTTYRYVTGSLDANNQNDSVRIYVAPIALPHGAKLTKLKFRGSDTDASTAVEVALRKRVSDLSVSDVNAVNTGIAFADGDTSAEVDLDHTVDNENNSYFIKAEFGHKLNRLYDVRISYTLE